MSITYTYYWEHPTDESRYLRSSNARKMAEVAAAQGGEVGVIVNAEDRPLMIRGWEMGGEPIKSMASWLVFQRRLGVSEATRS